MCIVHCSNPECSVTLETECQYHLYYADKPFCSMKCLSAYEIQQEKLEAAADPFSLRDHNVPRRFTLQ